MKRGDLYLVKKPDARDPKKQRPVLVVSRQALIDSNFSTVICAPIYSQHDGLTTQVPIGITEGLKRDSSVHCDELMSIPKVLLTNFIGSLGRHRFPELDRAPARALSL